MVIVDTCIWVDSWKARDERLDGWMAADLILQHPYVTAELAMGSFRSANQRAKTIALLESFGQLPVIDSATFHAFVAEHTLFGTGIGFADAHLIHACKCNPIAQLVTRDKRLADQANRLEIEVLT